MELPTAINVRADLCRLARFAANISDSHSCFIFLPSRLLKTMSGSGAGSHLCPITSNSAASILLAPMCSRIAVCPLTVD